jgi:hypothetical protein
MQKITVTMALPQGKAFDDLQRRGAKAVAKVIAQNPQHFQEVLEQELKRKGA